MKNAFARLLSPLAAIALMGPLTIGAASAAPFDPNLPVARPAAGFKFDDITPQLKFADAFGDRASAAHGRFGLIAGNWATPSHVHSAAYHGVVIRGVVTNGFNGEANPPKMGPGSYWYVPANVVHVTACVSKESCLTYVQSDGKFDLTPAEPK